MQLHRIAANFYGCSAKIRSSSELTEALRAALDASGLKVLGTKIVDFQPHGTTAVFILAESHAVASTWPEANFVSLDLALCAKAETGEGILDSIERFLEPTHVTRDTSVTPIVHASGHSNTGLVPEHRAEGAR